MQLTAFCPSTFTRPCNPPSNVPRRDHAPHRAVWCAAPRSRRFVTATLEVPDTCPAEWHAATDTLTAAVPQLDAEVAHAAIARAFGWSSQKFWRGRVKKAVPDPAVVSAALAELTALGLDDARVTTLLARFPEVLAVGEVRIRHNLQFITRSYPALTGPRLMNAVVENPAVLGYDFDCEGDCKSECARCWVQF